MMTAEIAGPISRDVFQIVELMPMADVISSRVTIVPIRDWRNGWCIPCNVPWISARPNSSSMVITPVSVNAASAVAWTILAYWMNRTIFSRSTRSAKAPAMGADNTVGARSPKATRPSHVPDFVSSHASQPMAIRCIHVPRSEGIAP